MSKDIPRFMKELLLRREASGLKLNKSSDLKDLPDGDIKDAIVFGYKSENVFQQTVAVLINAIISSKKKEFILSRALLKEYFQRDPNVRDKEFSGDQVKRIIGTLTQVGLFERISEASMKGGPKRKAAIYRVINKEILDLL